MPSHADSSHDKRARILEAAYRVCERRGVDGARMEEVAALARVSKGTLYRFFESKEQLLLATIIDSYEQSLPVFDAPVESDAGPRKRLDALLDGMTKILEEVSPRMNVHYQAWGLVAKVPELQDRLFGFLREFHSQRAQSVESAVREGQSRGVFRADANARALADGFQALLSGFLYRATFDPERAGPEQLRIRLGAMVRDALLLDIRNTRGPMADRASVEPFSEKGFYLNEFRGRTLAIAVRAEDLSRPAPLEALLEELEANATRVVLLSTENLVLEDLLGAAALAASELRFEGEVWRALSHAPHVGVVCEGGEGFARTCREIVLRLALSKLVWVDAAGGLRRADASRCSFVDLEELRRLLRNRASHECPARLALLREIEMALSAGVGAVNLSTLEGLADELFTYAGSGTLFTRERYVLVRRLGLDDYDAAADLIARGVAEGYLVPRTPEEVERIFVSGFGAFVEGRHLAGIGALLEHPGAGAAEIASLYTLTRFLGEGIGGHLVRFALERARDRGFGFAFACTTSGRVVDFFERQGFHPVGAEEIPAEKWRVYAPDRRGRVRCLRCHL